VAELLKVLREKSPEIKNIDVAVCPAYVFLPMTAEALKDTAITWGAQDVSLAEAGAHTGDIGAEMLKDWGCHYVLVGHSERRTDHGESDDQVVKKYRRAVEAGLQPVLCVGETLQQREAGKTLAIVEQQLKTVLDTGVGKEMIIAYEPVWAIGTGKTASAAQAQEVHAFIRQQLRKQLGSRAATSRILYGGSVKAENAKELFTQTDIDGGLIGGASLEVNEFIEICKAAI